MTTITLDPPVAVGAPVRNRGRIAAVTTLAARRLALSARTPRELFLPLMAPVLFAVVIAPALADTTGASPQGLDYMTFVAVSTLVLLMPQSCMVSGLGVVVDRLGGGRPDLLAAPIPRSLIVLGNLVVALFLCTLQVVVLLGASVLRGAELELSASGVGWFVATAVGFSVAMYGVAEILANRMPTQEEYIGTLPPVAIMPWFFAGSLFPIAALPAGLTVVAKLLPTTHALALMRYALVDGEGQGLRDIWGMDDPTAMAALSLGVVALFAAGFTALAIRSFARSAVR